MLLDDADEAAREFENRWGERGDIAAYFADEERVVSFLQDGYRAGRPPSVANAVDVLGETLASLWITGSARELLDHYFTAERTKVNAAMDVSESGPVSIDEPFSAFVMPMMSSGSVFGGYYGYVKHGIWQITLELGKINQELGAHLEVSSTVQEVDVDAGIVRYENTEGEHATEADHIIFATDPQTAARLTGDDDLVEHTLGERVLGTSGKLNLMFRNPIQWKHGSDDADSDMAFRYMFAVETLDAFDEAALGTVDGEAFVPGYFQVYCEGASMRRMGLNEPYERLAVFFKNLGLGPTGAELTAVEQEVKAKILEYVANPEDCVWSRLLTPRDLQETFGFPGGNIEHTMLGHGQSYSDRQLFPAAIDASTSSVITKTCRFVARVTYPCGSVAGTPAYMCVKELLRSLN